MEQPLLNHITDHLSGSLVSRSGDAFVEFVWSSASSRGELLEHIIFDREVLLPAETDLHRLSDTL